MDADTDPLTGAINRRLWQRHAETLVNKAHASHQPLSILFIDIDHFKELNDQYGHHVGDQALGTLVDFLHDQLRDSDLLGRYGGDEFVVALPGCNADSAKRMGERLRRGIERLYRRSSEATGSLTISLGCAELRSDENAQSLLKRADKAMYSASPVVATASFTPHPSSASCTRRLDRRYNRAYYMNSPGGAASTNPAPRYAPPPATGRDGPANGLHA